MGKIQTQTKLLKQTYRSAGVELLAEIHLFNHLYLSLIVGVRNSYLFNDAKNVYGDTRSTTWEPVINLKMFQMKF